MRPEIKPMTSCSRGQLFTTDLHSGPVIGYSLCTNYLRLTNYDKSSPETYCAQAGAPLTSTSQTFMVSSMRKSNPNSWKHT